MFQNENSYTLRIDVMEGGFRYFVLFRDKNSGIRCEVEVSHSIYLEFQRSAREEHSQARRDRRHIEQSELTDQSLYDRAMYKPKSVEDTVLDNLQAERLAQVIAELPETMRRRISLYHNLGLTYEQIAEREGCKRQPVMRSIARGEEKIRNKFQKEGYVFGSKCPNI